MPHTWDPLEFGFSSKIFENTIKRQIRNILKSYTGWYDPFCELIQNALDAVDNRKKIDEKYTPIIWIQIDLKNNIISVTDNGIGFNQEEFMTFLAPNVSFKVKEDRGNKGVGATYLSYGFNYLQIGTKMPDYSFSGVLKSGREWLEDDSGTIPRPKVQETKAYHDIFDGLERGSTFTLKLIGKFIRPKDLSWTGANNADQWEVVLRTKTPLGGIYFNRDCLLSKCRLTVVDETGMKTEKDITECKYIYPHEAISACKSLNEIRDVQKELIKTGKDASKLPDSYYGLNGLYAYWDYSDLVKDTGQFKGEWNDNEKSLATHYKLSIYGFFGYSTDIWDKYNDDVVGLRKKGRILRGGIQIATNSMPQGELQIIPLTQNIGYQNVTHVVVHFNEAEPDLGRKGFQPELENLAQHVSTSVVNIFLDWRKLLQKESGAPPDIIGSKNIHDWIREQEEHEKKHPLRITRKDVFLPTKEASITSEPTSEQDVISLFNQLLAGGVIRGIRLMATSMHHQYDGVCRLILKKPFENHVYEKNTNPLGILETNIKQEYISAPMILEYKYSFNGLIEEIEKGDKNEREVELLVAWEMGNRWITRYEITPLLHFDNLQHRYFHGGTHIIKSAATGDRVFPAIILSELVQYINEPAAVQDFQSKTYIKK